LTVAIEFARLRGQLNFKVVVRRTLAFWRTARTVAPSVLAGFQIARSLAPLHSQGRLTICAISTARAAASGRRAHHMCSVLG
jgi:hypothetical protein